MTASVTQIPVAEGLFEIDDAGIRLIGTRCVSCESLYFPQAPGCRNPQCRDKELERTALPERGTLYSYTVQRYQPPALFRVDGWAPYALGLVDLGQGLQVMGMLADIPLDAIVIGMPLKLSVKPLYTDDRGLATVTYAFVPDTTGDHA